MGFMHNYKYDIGVLEYKIIHTPIKCIYKICILNEGICLLMEGCANLTKSLYI